MNLSKYEQLRLHVLDRAKAIVALLGVVLNLLYSIQAVNPNSKIQALIALLTVIGVHATPNL